MAKSAMLAAGVAGVVAAVLFVPMGADAASTTKVTIVANTAVMTYGGTEPAYGYTVYGLANGDSLTRNPTCTAAAHRNVGQYAITCSGATANPAKYTITYAAGSLYVGKAPLYVGPAYTQKVYGEPDPAIGYATYGLQNGDKLTKTPTCSVPGAHAAVGRYTSTCTGADAGGNYDLRYVEGKFDVTKRPLYVGPNNHAIYFGTPEPAFTSSSYGLVSGDKLVKEPTCGVAGEHVHVGTYKITCTGAEATSNYSLSVLDGTYTVGQNETVVGGDRPNISTNILGQPTGAKLRAQLYLGHPYYQVFADQPLVFTSGDTTLCTLPTDKNGYATCTVGAKAAALVKTNGYTVTYAGQGPADKQDVKGSTATIKTK